MESLKIDWMVEPGGIFDWMMEFGGIFDWMVESGGSKQIVVTIRNKSILSNFGTVSDPKSQKVADRFTVKRSHYGFVHGWSFSFVITH